MRQLIARVAGLALLASGAVACTGITLKAKDGSVLSGRTMEWGLFDLQSRIIIVPRGLAVSAELSDGKPGMTWQTRYGVVGLDAVNKNIVVDGMNEQGLRVGLFYHPGFAQYQAFDPAQASVSLAPTDLGTYLLTTCANLDEARAAVAKVRVVPVVESSLGIVAPVHYVVTDREGHSIVIEYLGGQPRVFDAPLGVITNAPTYDWHETNLRNYINLSPVAIPDRKIDDLDFRPLGGGSGMIGLPGDFTPPSRFVRAVAFSATARPTSTGDETRYEVFRILDNFNVPLGAAEAGGHEKTAGMRSATLWTTCFDTRKLVLYYHTMNNRRVREVDLTGIDFTGGPIRHLPLDKVKAEDIENVTPAR